MVTQGVPGPRLLLHGFEIDFERNELRTVTGAHVELRPRSFAVLRLLAQNAGRLVTKDEIMARVWDDAAVTEHALTQCIADIRRTIGDNDRGIIRTIARRGYLLAAESGAPVSPQAAGIADSHSGQPGALDPKNTGRQPLKDLLGLLK